MNFSRGLNFFMLFSSASVSVYNSFNGSGTVALLLIIIAILYLNRLDLEDMERRLNKR